MRASQTDKGTFRGVLVTSLGGSPNAGQRKTLQAVADADSYCTCICTDSSLARGVIIAINWLFSTPMHALPYNDVGAALEILAIPLTDRNVIEDVVERLQAQVSALGK